MQVRCSSGTDFMQNLHFSLTIKTGFAIILSSFIASPAFAANCPRGYGEVKEYKKNFQKLALLDYEEAYSPELPVECVRISPSSYTEKCGRVMISSLKPLRIRPSNPSLESIAFERVDGLDYETFRAFNLPDDFQFKENEKKWCEKKNSNTVICYKERKPTELYLPNYTYDGAIRKKAFIQYVFRTITECSKISL